MKFETFEDFIKWLETDPTDEEKTKAFMSIPQSWNMRFLREAQFLPGRSYNG